MKIEEMKDLFISILSAQISESGKASFYKSGEVYLHNSVLEENNLGGRTFWDVICPLLVKEGFLIEYNDPSKFGSDFNQYLFRSSEYQAIQTPIWRESTREESGLWRKKFQDISSELYKGFHHKFIINEEKILNKARKESSGKYMSFDDKRTIIYKSKSRHVFHDDIDGKGLPLRFFKLLWKSRNEIKGENIRKGERQDEHFYARELGLSSIDKSFYKTKKTTSKTAIYNLVKGLNRIFKNKGFPAKIDSNGGILFEVKNP